MSDPELEAIRQQRLAQLQSQYRGGHVEDKQAMEEKRQQMEDMRNSILTQVLDQSAGARLNTLRLAKPEKGKMVEEAILKMAQRGMFHSRLGEEELINLIQVVSSQTQTKTTVKFDRRRAALDSDATDDDD